MLLRRFVSETLDRPWPFSTRSKSTRRTQDQMKYTLPCWWCLLRIGWLSSFDLLVFLSIFLLVSRPFEALSHQMKLPKTLALLEYDFVGCNLLFYKLSNRLLFVTCQVARLCKAYRRMFRLVSWSMKSLQNLFLWQAVYIFQMCNRYTDYPRHIFSLPHYRCNIPWCECPCNPESIDRDLRKQVSDEVYISVQMISYKECTILIKKYTYLTARLSI